MSRGLALIYMRDMPEREPLIQDSRAAAAPHFFFYSRLIGP